MNTKQDLTVCGIQEPEVAISHSNTARPAASYNTGRWLSLFMSEDIYYHYPVTELTGVGGDCSHRRTDDSIGCGVSDA